MATNNPATKITLTPPYGVLNTLPGQTLTTKFKLENSTSTSLNFQLRLVEVQNGQIIEDPTKFTSASWASLSSSSVAIQSNQAQEVTVTIKVPTEVNTSSHQLAVLVTSQAATSSTSGPTAVAQIAAAYQLNVNVLKSLPTRTVDAVATAQPKFTVTGQIDINTQVNNLAEITIYPIAYLRVFSPKGQLIHTSTINDSLQAVTPRQTLSQDWHLNLTNTNIIEDAGQYHVELLAIDNNLQKSSLVSLDIWYIPWQLIAVSVLAVVIFATALIVLYRNRRRLL
jgi:hypothetical protein